MTHLNKQIYFAAFIAVGYLYLIRQPLSWTPTFYGIFSGYTFILKGVVVVIAVPILKKKFHVRDTTILIWAFVTAVADMVVFSFSVKTWMVFLCKYK